VFFNSVTNESNTLNFSEHPLLTASYDHSSILQLRDTAKEIGVLFAAGSIDPALYSSPILMRAFGVMNRHDLLEVIMRYPGAVVVGSEFYPANQHHQLVIRTEKVPQKSWLELLASSRFYITPSGVVMPMCHNIIEAMSVGTVPVTQYPNLFWPPLTHLRNCITFTDEHDLTNKIDFLLSMNSDQFSQMRDEVLAYYDNFLCPGANTERILHMLRSPHHAHDLFCIAGSASLRALGWRMPLRWRIDLTVHSVRRRLRSYFNN
jgi:hypothetical protein